MKIEALTVCLGYDDFLEETLLNNKCLFDRMLVVTSPDDKATRAICDQLHVEAFVTDAFKYKGKFNKGNAIEAALTHMNPTDWVVHMDCDIFLPAKSGHILHNLNLNEQCIYGIDRMMCPSYKSWLAYKKAKLPQHELAYVHPGPFKLGTRICKLEHGGYIPIGFFQMFHRAASVLASKPWYPTEWGNAATSDELFSLKWDRAHRHMLPEIIGIHLESANDHTQEMGVNWEGRKTKRFEPEQDPESIFGDWTRIPPKFNECVL